MHSFFLQFQISYFLVKDGTLDVRILESLTEVIRRIGNQPGLIYYWKVRRSIFFEEFRAYIDEIFFHTTDQASEGIYKLDGDDKTQDND